MAEETEIRNKLKQLREATGLSMRKVASELGVSASSYGHYETRYKKDFLPQDITLKLADLFERHGVDRASVLDLAGVDAPAQPGAADIADQVAEIVRLFLAIEDPTIRESRFKMLQAVLAPDGEVRVRGSVVDLPGAARRS